LRIPPWSARERDRDSADVFLPTSDRLFIPSFKCHPQVPPSERTNVSRRLVPTFLSLNVSTFWRVLVASSRRCLPSPKFSSSHHLSVTPALTSERFIPLSHPISSERCSGSNIPASVLLLVTSFHLPASHSIVSSQRPNVALVPTFRRRLLRVFPSSRR
jgi:hypothetical protein